MQHCFNDADLAKDYNKIKQIKNVEKILEEEAFGDKSPKSKVQFKDDKKEMKLNQNQMVRVYKKLYDYDKAKDNKKDKLNKDKLKDLEADDDGSYSDYYKRMKEMADDKKLNDKQFRDLLNNRSKGESDYKIWLAKNLRKKEKFAVTEKLHQDRYDRDYIKAKVKRAKEVQEEDEAIELAHKHSDKHVYNYNVRTVDQFIDDQIYFERRKVDRIRDLQDEKEIIEDTLHPLRPDINPTS